MNWNAVSSRVWVMICLGMILFFCANTFSQEVIELKLSHFAMPVSTLYMEVLKPWTENIETLTNGRVKFTIYPQETAGKANEFYDFVIQGKTDIAVSSTEYTPGRFPLSFCMELPFLGARNGKDASLAYWHLYKKYLKEEFKDTHILWLFCHGMGQLHTTAKTVKTLEDLQGLQIRVSDPTLAKIAERLGAKPVICSLYEGRTLFEEGKLDGIIVPWHITNAYGYLKFCRYHTEINMHALPLFVAMNREKYESLPADIRQVIDENSGEKMAALSGQVLYQTENKVKRLAEERGDFIYKLPDSELARWKKITMPIGDEWIQNMETMGLPGKDVLGFVLNLFDQIQSTPSEKSIEMKIFDIGPETWPPHAKILKPWSQKIEEQSAGKLHFTLFIDNSSENFCKPYDMAVQGTADIGCILIDYCHERFPIISVMAQPFLGIKKSETASLVLWQLYKKYSEYPEFNDAQILWLHTTGIGQLHTIHKPVRSVEDIKGLRIRVPNLSIQKALALLGAKPVFSSISNGYTMMKEGKLDGICTTWTGATTYGYMEYCKYHTEINMYASTIAVVMNKNRYNTLPPELKKIIDENGGEPASAMAGRLMDESDMECRNAALARGDAVFSLSDSEMARWKKITMSEGDEWVREMQAKGYHSREIIAYVNESLNYINNLLNQP